MANNNWDDLRSTLIDALGVVTDKVMDLADAAADTARSSHQIAKLTMEKRKQEQALRAKYEQLGKLYYDLEHDRAEGVFADLCSELDGALENLEDIKEEIATLKETMGEQFDDIEIEFSEFFDDAPQDTDFESVVHDAESAADGDTPEE